MFDHERHLTQFTPARAKKSLTIDEVTASNLWWEQKIDGERYVTHTDVGGTYQHGVTSRRLSEVTGRMVEKTDRVPHISNHGQLPRRSMLDSEFVSSGDMILVDLPGKFWDKLMEPNHPHMVWLSNKFGGAIPVYPHVGNTVSIMGSLGPEAVRKQQERGLIWAYTFDIIQYEGKSLVSNPQAARRRFLASLMEVVDPESGILLMPAWYSLSQSEICELFYLLTDPGNDGEGLVGKDPTQKYNAASNWWKLKKDWPCDVVYTGESKEGEEGKTGKMIGFAASLEIGVYYGSRLIPIGWISGIRGGMSNLQTPAMHRITWAGKAVECRHNGLQVESTSPIGYTLRHPRFRRDRDDKNPTDCTWEALYAEAKKSRD